MMLGKETNNSSVEKRYTEKVAKEKRSQFGPGYNPKVVSARPPPPNAEIKWYDQTGVSTFNNASSSVPVHAAVGSLNLISQGDQGRQSEWAKDHGT